MAALMTKQVLIGAGLMMVLALPAAHGQTPADPAAPTTSTAPGPTGTDTTGTDTTGTDAGATSSDESVAATTEPASAPRKPRFRIGPEIGVYLPTSSKTRDQFGSTWLTLGLGLGSIGRITPKGQTSFDLQILYQSRNGNHAFLAPIGVGYRTAIRQSGANTVYVGATGDLYLADLRSGAYNVHSGLRTGVGGSVLTGINFGESGFAEARYLFVSRIKSFDLSGLNLTAGYRF